MKLFTITVWIKTLEITTEQACKLLAPVETSNSVGCRDRAILSILVYTAARAGAVAKLKCGRGRSSQPN